VIIPARDAAPTIGAALEGLHEQEHPFELLVVDDGSRDDTAQIATAGGARLIRAPGRGVAQARNAGAAAAGGDILVFLDADCRPVAGWLAAGVRALQTADFVQGRTLPDPRSPRGPFDRTLSVTRASGLYESANLFVARSLFERLGGFESWLGPKDGKELGEDVWFGWRARRAGARMEFCDAALAYHAVFPRRPGGYVSERARLRFFPAMARRMPELRDALFYQRWFLTRRTAAFDAAVTGTALAWRTKRPWPLAAALPYVRLSISEARLWGWRRLPIVLFARVAADGVGLASLAFGSLKSRSPLL
jgi:glycosyltransferase involved in cell wall biosynthesis